MKNISNANLRDADLQRVNLSGNNFSGSDFSGAQMNHMKLKDSVISDSDLSSADFAGVVWYYVGAKKAIMKGTILKGAKLVYCNFDNVRFDNLTNFTGAEIDWFTIEHLKTSEWEKAKWDPYILEQLKNNKKLKLYQHNFLSLSFHNEIYNNYAKYGKRLDSIVCFFSEIWIGVALKM